MINSISYKKITDIVKATFHHLLTTQPCIYHLLSMSAWHPLGLTLRAIPFKSMEGGGVAEIFNTPPSQNWIFPKSPSPRNQILSPHIGKHASDNHHPSSFQNWILPWTPSPRMFKASLPPCPQSFICYSPYQFTSLNISSVVKCAKIMTKIYNTVCSWMMVLNADHTDYSLRNYHKVFIFC